MTAGDIVLAIPRGALAVADALLAAWAAIVDTWTQWFGGAEPRDEFGPRCPGCGEALP